MFSYTLWWLCFKYMISMKEEYKYRKMLTRSLGIHCYCEGNFFFSLHLFNAYSFWDAGFNVTSSPKSPNLLVKFSCQVLSHTVPFLSSLWNLSLLPVLIFIVWLFISFVCPPLGFQPHQTRGLVCFCIILFANIWYVGGLSSIFTEWVNK